MEEIIDDQNPREMVREQKKIKRSKLLYVFLTMLTVGVLFKVLHWPFGGLIVIISATSLFIAGIIKLIGSLAVKYKSNRLEGFQLLGVGAFCMYVMFRIQFWPGQIPMYYFALALLTVLTIMLIKGSVKKSGWYIAIVAMILFSSYLKQLPGHVIYKAINLNDFFFDSSTSPRAHDRYSWFLLLWEEYDLALEANEKAVKAIKKCEKEGFYIGSDVNEYMDLLNDHRYVIENQADLSLWVHDYGYLTN